TRLLRRRGSLEERIACCPPSGRPAEPNGPPQRDQLQQLVLGHCLGLSTGRVVTAARRLLTYPDGCRFRRTFVSCERARFSNDHPGEHSRTAIQSGFFVMPLTTEPLRPVRRNASRAFFSASER